MFDHRRFDAWWFETGTPTFLIRTLVERGTGSPSLDGMLGTSALLSQFDVDAMATEALLFQTGYLTVAGVEDLGGRPLYRLSYPNREVRQSLNESLLEAMLPDAVPRVEQGVRLHRLLAANDFDGLEALFRAFFSGIPHDWHRRNDLARYEGYWASVFYSHFAAAGLDVAVEDSTSHGRLDMAVRFRGSVYLFEFKVIGMAPEGVALAQLKSRRYADKYRASGQPIWLVGVEFSRESRNLAAFEVERA